MCKKRTNILSLLFTTMLCVILPISQAFTKDGKVTSVHADIIEMDIGSEKGLKVGDTGRVYYTVTISGEVKSIYIAKFKVTHVTLKTSIAKIEDKTKGVEVGYFVELTTKEDLKVSSETDEDCVKKITEKGILLMSLQGGYISLKGIPSTSTIRNILKSVYPNLSIPIEGTAYAYHNNSNQLPSIEAVKKSLELYLKENIPKDCKAERGAKNQGHFFKVSLDDSKIRVDASWIVNITQGEAQGKVFLREIRTEVPVRLKGFLNIVRKMVDEQMRASQRDVCLSCWTLIAHDNNLKVEIQKIDEDTFFLITDKSSKIMGKDYEFIFAIQLK